MKFTIAKKIIISVVTMIIVSTVMGGYSYFAVNKASDTSTLIAQGLVPMMGYNTELVGYSFMMEDFVQRYYFQGQDTDLNVAQDNIKKVKATFQKMKTLIESPTGRNGMPKTTVVFHPMEKSLTEYTTLAERGLDIMKKSKVQEAEALKISTELAALLMQYYDFMQERIIYEIQRNDIEATLRAENFMHTVTLMSFTQIRADNLFYNGISGNNHDAITQGIKMYEEVIKTLEYQAARAKMPETLAYIKQCNELMTKLSSLMSQISETYVTIASISLGQDKIGHDMNGQIMQLASTLSGATVLIAQKAADDMNALTTAILVLLILTVLVGCAIFFILRMSVTLKINQFRDVVKDLTSGDGDLTKRLPVVGSDELAELGAYFNRFIINVQEIVSEVKLAADNLASGNNELAATMEELSSTFNSQTEEVSGIVNEMENIQNASSRSVKELNGCMDIMNATVKETAKGSRDLSEVESSIVAIRKQTESLSETIKRLSDSSSQIGEILTVINDIADQTNLLALNAAIEAARAGDAGRGFAVVADEVRKLAERTQKATSEIENIITALQRESDLASKEMTYATKSVETGVSVIGKTAQTFNNVVKSVVGVTDMTRGVVTSVAGQNTTVQNVGDKTQIIASGVEESNAAVSEITITVAHLQESAGRMKSLVGQFKS